MAWRGIAQYTVWPCGHGMVYGMAWRDMVYDITWRAWHGDLLHGILYGLADTAWYMIRPGEVWHCIWKCLCEFHVLWHYRELRSRSHVEKPK